ncbi:glycosyltransferase [Telmatospirillum siberiense]|uniref:Glycosyl transferase family 1 n=1 Tax=Telmatospirillum siberiense TaxID=382514 RepID=A0A2N3PVQ0_9PROT|nr:glycosyltransferase [Telmatospirillum siberiense]PKU24465.1 glycosyl transferase family 1 [Telmatospirillum siberiense]
MSKTTVTMVATHVTPAKGYGGVAESAFNLCSAWARKQYSFRLCVSDGSTEGRVTAAAIGLPHFVRVDLFRAILFKRWGFGPGALLSVLRSCLAAHTVYICGIANWPTTLAALVCTCLRRPFVVAPRGGLMRSTVATIKADKPHKWLFYRCLTLPTMRAAAYIHITSDLEQQGIRDLLPEARSVLVPNGLDLTSWPIAPTARQKRLTFCYVGRISREKGINRFLEIWLANRQQGERVIVVGDVQGRGNYGDRFKALVEQSAGAIELTGYLPRNEISTVLAHSDFLVLPSGIEANDIRENFGNCVAESLASGRPVLVSKGLAWDFAETDGLGLLFDKTEENIAAAIERARAIPDETYARMCRTARSYAENNLDINVTSDKLWSVVSALGVRGAVAEVATPPASKRGI